MAGMELEIPRDLPTGSLSYSALMEYLRCPLKYKQRYIDNLWEPRSAPLLLGRSFDIAASSNYTQKIESQTDLPEEQVLDEFSSAWDRELTRNDEPEVVFDPDEPEGKVKDKGVRVVQTYVERIAPHVQPVHVQRRLSMHFPDTNWSFSGVLDVETDSQVVADMKVKGKMFSQAELASDIQSTSYLALRRANGEPARRFEFHLFRTLTNGVAPDIIPLERMHKSLDTFEARLVMTAREIAWRAENEHWTGALPGSWWCSNRYCGFWKTCPFGGG